MSHNEHRPKGMLSLEQLRGLAAQELIETVIVGFTDHYGRLVGKRYDAEMFVEEVYNHGTHGCDYLLTTDMEMEPVPGYQFANWELGYGDFHLVPDLHTLRTERRGTCEALERKLTEVQAGLTAFPHTLRLDQQGVFCLGYYHQRAAERAAARAYREGHAAARAPLSTPDTADHAPGRGA